MSDVSSTTLIAVVSGVIALVAVIALIYVPLVRIYPTWWQRVAATVLATVVVFAFVVGGMYGGLQFVDRFLS